MSDYFPQEIIRRKRDGDALSDEALAFLVEGMASGAVSEGQAAAFAMATFLRGMTPRECAALTRAMRDSGTVLDWRGAGLTGPAIDKHSTGGVGDKVSLVLAPVVAACGGAVPMISGRGLGHTGGTLDKLDSIPGYDTRPDLATFRGVVAEIGCAIVGQTGKLAPADGRLYAIRDVTATVESVPLITASILSKKLAAGLDALVLDVKTGSGAFMAERDAAGRLARSIVEVAGAAGLACSALVTDMNQVLGRTAGNALEVREAVDFLRGERRERRLLEIVTALSAELLGLGGLAADDEAARAAIAEALASGAAAERFARMVAALGGPGGIVDAPGAHLPAAPVQVSVAPAGEGSVRAMDTRALGVAVMRLGGGRRRATDAIDHAVGLSDLASIGEAVGPERPLCRVHARRDEDARLAAATVRAAISVGEAAAAPPLVYERISAG
ncbi:MAG: thymidine phosphorylase [Alphaproteobacteria bacterium]|nr:thymidine phosphorylase [Alphaproteobacteria bacterium]